MVLYLNTSHVKVNQSLVLVLIVSQADLNTSHVKVNPTSTAQVIYLNSNTSHVKVNPFSKGSSKSFLHDLNTSHVKVNQDRILLQFSIGTI